MLRLIDEGTLDTVFRCDRCRVSFRFSDFPRDENGNLDPDEVDAVELSHDEDECQKIKEIFLPGRNFS